MPLNICKAQLCLVVTGDQFRVTKQALVLGARFYLSISAYEQSGEGSFLLFSVRQWRTTGARDFLCLPGCTTSFLKQASLVNTVTMETAHTSTGARSSKHTHTHTHTDTQTHKQWQARTYMSQESQARPKHTAHK